MSAIACLTELQERVCHRDAQLSNAAAEALLLASYQQIAIWGQARGEGCCESQSRNLQKPMIACRDLRVSWIAMSSDPQGQHDIAFFVSLATSGQTRLQSWRQSADLSCRPEDLRMLSLLSLPPIADSRTSELLKLCGGRNDT